MLLPSPKGYRIQDLGFRIRGIRSRIKDLGFRGLIVGSLVVTALTFFSLLVTGFSTLTPIVKAVATCDPSVCCTCGNAYTDADNDGYTVGGPVSVCFDPGPPPGYRAQPSSGPDCNDSDPTVGYIPAQACPTYLGYNGGYVPDGNCGQKYCPATCRVNTGQSCTACNSCGSCNSGTYRCDGSCSASAPAVPTWYLDADGDGYGNPNSAVQSCTQPQSCYTDAYGSRYCISNYVKDNTDCYDSNAQVHPGQTQFFSVNRGDGSFDYNCDGTITVGQNVQGYQQMSYGYYKNSWCDAYGCYSSCYGATAVGNGSTFSASGCGSYQQFCAASGNSAGVYWNGSYSNTYYTDSSCTSGAATKWSCAQWSYYGPETCN